MGKNGTGKGCIRFTGCADAVHHDHQAHLHKEPDTHSACSLVTFRFQIYKFFKLPPDPIPVYLEVELGVSALFLRFGAVFSVCFCRRTC